MSIIEQMKGTFSNFFAIKEDSYPGSPTVVSKNPISKNEDIFFTDAKYLE